MNRNKILWITRTAVLTAVLVVLQWATSGLGQLVTGSCVNAVLVIAALGAGLWSGVTVAALSPFCAFLLGIGPKLIQIVPAIALGNIVLVAVVYFIIGTGRAPLWKQAAGAAAGAAAKFVMLYLAVVQVLLPAMGPNLAQKQVQTFTAMFSWPQLITALIGSTVALLLLPVVRKAIKRP